MPRRRRWWVLCAFGRSPLVRSVDRAEGWGVLAMSVVLLGALLPATHVSHAVQVAEARVIATETSNRHEVDAVATAPSETKTNGTSTTNSVTVRWFDGSATREHAMTVPKPVDAGDSVRIWVDGQGQFKPPPRHADAAMTSGIGAGVLLWCAVAALSVWALSMLRRTLDRRRDRDWDHALRVLVGNGGGWNAHNS